MAEVSLSINGRPYKIACDDGQEDRVHQLGAYIDDRVSQIASAGAASNDSHLLVLAGLVLTDELFELKANGHDQAAAAAPQQEAGIAGESEVAELVNHLATRIEALADRLEPT